MHDFLRNELAILKLILLSFSSYFSSFKDHSFVLNAVVYCRYGHIMATLLPSLTLFVRKKKGLVLGSIVDFDILIGTDT